MGFFEQVIVKSACALVLLQCLPGASAVNYLITFGDSYTQTGYEPTGAPPSPGNPLGNPAFPGYTTSGGKNWIGYLVEDFNTSLLYSYNFAYGGATVNASLVAPYRPGVLSLIDQVAEFSASAVATDPQWTAQDALFGVWMGVNDVGNSYGLNDSALVAEVIEDYFEQVEILFQTGARNFVFLNVPPINKTPLMLASPESYQDLEAEIIAQYNGLLAQRVQVFESSHTGVKTAVVDTQAPFNTAISANPDESECFNSDGVSCLWYNNFHPGQTIHRLVAEAVAHTVTWNTGLSKTKY